MIELLIEDNRGNVIRHQLGEGRHTLGKSPKSDIVLMDGYASRYHADIIVARQGIFIIDANSKNGIRYKDKTTRKTFRIENGESFSIGNLTLSISQPAFKMFIKDGRKSGAHSETVDLSEITTGNIDEAVSKLLQY